MTIPAGSRPDDEAPAVPADAGTGPDDVRVPAPGDPQRSRLPAGAHAALTELMARHHVPGMSVAVTDADGLLCATGLGFRDLAEALRATSTTSYQWFSMSKIVTATAVLRLADEGRLDLDSPVSTYVPGCVGRQGTPPPRVRQLLSHTAGLGNPLPIRWVRPAERVRSDDRPAVRRLLERHGSPRRTPGGPARYSNVGYLVLAEVVEQVTGEPFAAHVGKAVLEPAGMRDTGFDLSPSAEAATGYVRAPRAMTPVYRAVLPAGIVGARHGEQLSLRPFRAIGAGYGGLMGPAPDVARLLRLHLRDGEMDGARVLQAQTAQAMRRISSPGRPFDVGLGWFRPAADRDTRPAFVEHWGTGGGFRNVMRLYPELGLGIVLMTNGTRPFDHDAAMRTLQRAFR
jgi:CubicO group peptidase (beta-lactamase class C family)